MAVDRSYIARNNASRQRLETRVARCTDSQLAQAMPAGWTVASVLAHMAFWDHRIQVLFEQWRSTGTAPAAEDASSVDWINDATKPLFLALPPRQAAELTVRAAGVVDRLVETLSDEMVTQNIRAGGPLNLVRAEHRDEHLDEIERALGG
jgi:uncharacterized damage-inducible protein DinB